VTKSELKEDWKEYLSADDVDSADGTTPAKEVSETYALTDVNVRRSAPRVTGNRAYYDCSVKIIKRGEKVQFQGVAAYRYAGDTFLWGVVNAEQLMGCSKS
jgi:hypothetical protein